MKNMVKTTIVLLFVVGLIGLICSCDFGEKAIGQNPEEKVIPFHDCEQYAVWKVEKYPTETEKGTKNLICDYCGKTLSSADVPLLSIGLAYEVREDGVWITGIGDCTDKNLVIPEQIGGKDVVGIADTAFQKNTFITSVVMPITLKNVGVAAFDGATSLADVIFGSNLEKLEWLSFRGCALTSLYVPGSVSGYYNMGTFAFSYCNSLKNVVLGEGIQRLTGGTFEYCSALEFISLPSTLVSIENAFYQSNNLKTVNFRGHIGQYCEIEKTENFFSLAQTYPIFYNATILVSGEPIPENVVIPEGTTKIFNRAFNGMNIKSVKIPDTVISIGSEAFANCQNLESVEFGEGIEIIGNSAFANCQNLKSVEFGKKIKTIGSSAFKSCVKLKEIKIYDGIETIGRDAFAYCRSIEIAEIGEGLQVLEWGVFWGAVSLKTLKIPSTLTKIEYIGYQGQMSLLTVYYGSTVEQWFALDGTSQDMFARIRIYCSDGEIFYNKVVK